MFKTSTVTERKFLYLDIVVLFSLLVVLPVLQDFEHFLTFKRPPTNIYLSTLPSNLYYFLTNFAICFIYYRLILKPLIFREKRAAVLISAVVFSMIHNFYTKYMITWLAIRLPFLDEQYRRLAQFRFDSYDIHLNLAMALGSNFLIMTGFAYFTKSLQQKEQMGQIRREQLVSEMTYLKAQLQPHFFFNTLNNIYALAVTQSPATGPMISRLSEMMRYIIYRTESVKVPLRLGEENSSYRVQIVVCVIQAELILEVVNSIPKTKLSSSKESGLGLTNLVKRLELLYPERHKLTIEQDEQNYQAQLSLKLI